jgi:hypothetical protein
LKKSFNVKLAALRYLSKILDSCQKNLHQSCSCFVSCCF